MTIDKVDVVICYYNHLDHWKYVKWGLLKNKEHINNIYIVKDGLWTTQEIERIWWDERELKIKLLEHEHTGFGLCKSANQGIGYANSDYVLLIEGDEVLPTNSIAETLSSCSLSPSTLLCCRKKYIKDIDDPFDLNFPDDIIFEDDHRLRYVNTPDPRYYTLRPWIVCSGGHLLINKAFHDKIGGFDERMGYGYHDYEYAARWMLEGGTIKYSGGEVWHIGYTNKGGTDGAVSATNNKIFVDTLAKLYNHKYNLGCDADFQYNMVNVDIVNCYAADVYLDCGDISWIDDDSANFIRASHFIEHLPSHVATRFIKQCYAKLRQGGKLFLCFPDILKCATRLANDEHDEYAMAGIYGDQEKNIYNKGQHHLYGYSTSSMSTILKDAGFNDIEVTDSDASQGHPSEWRDTVLIGTK